MAWTPLWEAEASPPWEVVVPSPPLAQAFLPWVLPFPLSSPPSTGMQCSLEKAFLSRETPGGAGQGQRYFGVCCDCAVLYSFRCCDALQCR